MGSARKKDRRGGRISFSVDCFGKTMTIKHLKDEFGAYVHRFERFDSVREFDVLWPLVELIRSMRNVLDLYLIKLFILR